MALFNLTLTIEIDAEDLADANGAAAVALNAIRAERDVNAALVALAVTNIARPALRRGLRYYVDALPDPVPDTRGVTCSGFVVDNQGRCHNCGRIEEDHD